MESKEYLVNGLLMPLTNKLLNKIDIIHFTVDLVPAIEAFRVEVLTNLFEVCKKSQYTLQVQNILSANLGFVVNGLHRRFRQAATGDSFSASTSQRRTISELVE